jgi:hypothetical protein
VRRHLGARLDAWFHQGDGRGFSLFDRRRSDTRCCGRSIGRTSRSGQPKIPSRLRNADCGRCKSMQKSTGRSRPRCAHSCALTRMSSWWGRCATPRPLARCCGLRCLPAGIQGADCRVRVAVGDSRDQAFGSFKVQCAAGGGACTAGGHAIAAPECDCAPSPRDDRPGERAGGFELGEWTLMQLFNLRVRVALVTVGHRSDYEEYLAAAPIG